MTTYNQDTVKISEEARQYRHYLRERSEAWQAFRLSKAVAETLLVLLSPSRVIVSATPRDGVREGA